MATEALTAAPLPSTLPGQRFLIAWQDPSSRRFETVGKLDHDDGGYTFRYLPRAHELGTMPALPEFPDLDRVYRSPRLFVLFAQRLMNPRRADYATWIDMLGLDPGAEAVDVLARSHGYRLGDDIRLFPEPSITESGMSRATFFVHGVRHRLEQDERVAGVLDEVCRGDALELLPDTNNPVNPLAVVVASSTVQLGFVPDPLAEYVGILLDSGPIMAVATQNNGALAPPNLRLLMTVSGRVPEGSRPFADI